MPASGPLRPSRVIGRGPAKERKGHSLHVNFFTQGIQGEGMRSAQAQSFTKKKLFCWRYNFAKPHAGYEEKKTQKISE